MNLLAASPKQSALTRLAAVLLTGLSKVSITRSRTRYVNLGEFPLHLQRDMGFLDGQQTPASSARDTGGTSPHDFLR